MQTRDERKFQNVIVTVQLSSDEDRLYRVVRFNDEYMLPLLAFAPGDNVRCADLYNDKIIDQIFQRGLTCTTHLFVHRQGRKMYWKWTTC
jgi:hypothetical protein